MNEPLAEQESPDQSQADWASSEFADLYAEHSRAIFYLALRFLSDPQKAEDATHDVFMKAFRKVNLYNPEQGKFTVWLTTVARHEAINHLRRMKRSRRLSSTRRSVRCAWCGCHRPGSCRRGSGKKARVPLDAARNSGDSRSNTLNRSPRAGF